MTTVNTAPLDGGPLQANESPLRSIAASGRYLGICRAQLYNILPELETVKIGGRRLVIKASMDAFIERSKVPK